MFPEIEALKQWGYYILLLGEATLFKETKVMFIFFEIPIGVLIESQPNLQIFF
jgi:hypothetical protein